MSAWPGQDHGEGIYFYARTWDFAPPSFKGPIEKKLEYWYKKYHGKLDGWTREAKPRSQRSLRRTLRLACADPARTDHTMLTDPSTKPESLALSDKETILALGTKDDADKIWAVMKDKPTPVPGIALSR